MSACSYTHLYMFVYIENEANAKQNKEKIICMIEILIDILVNTRCGQKVTGMFLDCVLRL